jgi:predicted DNA-binding protein (MmcQ/YjbR family)
MARRKRESDAALIELRKFGLAYPGAHTKSPWPGHLDLAVNDKTFAYLSIEGEPFSISCKLPRSSAIALMLPFAKPTAYGLGKSGWVSATPAAGEPVPVDLFKEWIDESYRAQAPKKLVAQLDGGAIPAGAAPARAAGKSPAKAPGRRGARSTPAGKSKTPAGGRSARPRAAARGRTRS